MKKVCVNRLKADVEKLQYFVNSMEHQEETLEALFQCILRLFENEMAQGVPCSVQGHMNATNGLLNSQSSIFNSKHNISGLALDSAVGMSFGKATDDGHLNKKGQNKVLGQSSTALIKNMNRQYNSDRNIFSQVNSKNGKTSSASRLKNLPANEELESEVVQMGELFRDSHEKKELKKRLTDQQEPDASPRFNNQSTPTAVLQTPPSNDLVMHHQRQDSSMDGQQLECQAEEDQSNLRQQHQQELPNMESESRHAYQLHASHQSPLQAASMTYGIPTSVKAAPYQQSNGQHQQQFMQKVQQSQETLNTSKLLGAGLSHLSNQVFQSTSWHHGTLPTAGITLNQNHARVQNGNTTFMNRDNTNGRSFKEVVKVFVTMMVEDIWAHYEGFSMQKRLLLQSEEKKKKKKRQVQANATTNIYRASKKESGKLVHELNLAHRDQPNGVKHLYVRNHNPLSDGDDSRAQSASSASSSSYASSDECSIDGVSRREEQIDAKTAAKDTNNDVILVDDGTGETQAAKRERVMKAHQPQLQNQAVRQSRKRVAEKVKPGSISEQRKKKKQYDSIESEQEFRGKQLLAATSDVKLAKPQTRKNKQSHAPLNTVPATASKEKKQGRIAQSYKIDRPSSLNLSKKSSSVSNYKMDFIDPGKNQKGGAGMISSRNTVGYRTLGNTNSSKILTGKQDHSPLQATPNSTSHHVGKQVHLLSPDPPHHQQTHLCARFVDLQPNGSQKNLLSETRAIQNNQSESVTNRKLTLDQIQAIERGQIFLNSAGGPNGRNTFDQRQHQTQHSSSHNQHVTGFETSKSEENLIYNRPLRQNNSASAKHLQKEIVSNVPSNKQNMRGPYFEMGQGKQSQHFGNGHQNASQQQPYHQKNSYRKSYTVDSQPQQQQQQQQQLAYQQRHNILNTTTSEDEKKSSFNNLTLRTIETVGSNAAGPAAQQAIDSCHIQNPKLCQGKFLDQPAGNQSTSLTQVSLQQHPNALFKQKSSNDAVKMRYMGSRNHDLQRLTLTTNSLVSPADLEAASDYEFDQHYKTISSARHIDSKAIVLNLDSNGEVQQLNQVKSHYLTNRSRTSSQGHQSAKPPQPQTTSVKDASSAGGGLQGQPQLQQFATSHVRHSQESWNGNAKAICGAASASQDLRYDTHKSSGPQFFPNANHQLRKSKDGITSSKEMSPEMTRRMLQNVAAIEKDLNLAPTVSKQIGTIHEDEDECELSDTQRTLKDKYDKYQKNRLFSVDKEGLEFPKRESNDEVHRAQMYQDRQFGSQNQDGSEQVFEDCIIDFEANPFGHGKNESRQYIDDMSSSSGNPSGYSENADCLPVVEHMQDSTNHMTTWSVRIGKELARKQQSSYHTAADFVRDGQKLSEFDTANDDSFARIANHRHNMRYSIVQECPPGIDMPALSRQNLDDGNEQMPKSVQTMEVEPSAMPSEWHSLTGKLDQVVRSQNACPFQEPNGAEIVRDSWNSYAKASLQLQTESCQQMPRPNRSSTSQDYHSMVREVGEREYEQMIIQTDKTHKQYQMESEQKQDPEQMLINTPKGLKSGSSRDHLKSMSANAAMNEECTTEKRKRDSKRTRQKNDQVLQVVAPLVERSGSHRQMQLSRPIQPAPEDRFEKREQPLSVRLLDHRNPGSTIVDEAQSHVTTGGRTQLTQQYETAEQVVNHYQNLNFMPQKNEGKDRLEILQKSREFNPVIEFDINSPFSSHQLGSSRSNSDIPMQTSHSLKVIQSQNFSNRAAGGKVLQIQSSSANKHQYENVAPQPKPGHGSHQVVVVKKSLESAATQLNYQPLEASTANLQQEAHHEATLSGGAISTSGQQQQYQSAQATGKGLVNPSSNTKTKAAPPQAPQILTQQQTSTNATASANFSARTKPIATSSTIAANANSSAGTDQSSQPALPPFSPNLIMSKSASKALQPLKSGGGKASVNNNLNNFTSKQYQANILNKKMMQADQQLAYQKQQKKLQNLSASAAVEKLNNGTSQQPQVVKDGTVTATKSVSQFDHSRQGSSRNDNQALNSGANTYTPKAIKGKSFAKQHMTLSSTINKGLQKQSNPNISSKKFK